MLRIYLTLTHFDDIIVLKIRKCQKESLKGKENIEKIGFITEIDKFGRIVIP